MRLSHRWQKVLVLFTVLNFLFMIYLLSRKQCDPAFLDNHHADERRLSAEQDNQVQLYRDEPEPRKRNDGDDDDESDDITFIFREFEFEDNCISKSDQNIAEHFPNSNILIVTDRKPYPPLFNLNKRTKIVTLLNEPHRNIAESRPENYILTKYVVIVPDGIKFFSDSKLKSFVNAFKELENTKEDVKIGAAGLEQLSEREKEASCENLRFDYQNWTLHYSYSYKETCDSIRGNHVVVMRTSNFHLLSAPYARPILNSLYIQANLHKWKVHFFKDIKFYIDDCHSRDDQIAYRKQQNEVMRLRNIYKQFGVKLVIHSDNVHNWYGCSKTSDRCFDTVYNDMPEYLYENHWTPPCCMKALRETAKHVFQILDDLDIRYWLEGGSLLGAARHKGIIPWDYDVDIGIYLEDVDKISYLQAVKNGGGVTDDQDYVWEKAWPHEGDYFRVQYSSTNHLHVDIWPFYSRDGIMTKDFWFEDHKQDKEFPEHFLLPLVTLEFEGMQVKAPNNHRQFLELKFGNGVIENAQYPQPNRIQMAKVEEEN
ncbi:ribitol 5-phosphate transferase FKRP-like [Antedon mediterranea]|uniref:ribitol 5-phosphate transferase FKRP-like n=1 Tax=Antedon mediterranea TaxID=105859 RepID=UPI003AF777A3